MFLIQLLYQDIDIYIFIMRVQYLRKYEIESSFMIYFNNKHTCKSNYTCELSPDYFITP